MPGDVAVRVHARDRDDPATVRHARRDSLHHLEEGADGDCIRLLDVMGLHLEERLEGGGGGVCDKHVDAVGLGVETIEGRGDRGRIAEVGLERQATPAEGAHRTGDRLGRRHVPPVEEGDVGAVARQALHDRAPDAARAAGDEGESHGVSSRGILAR